MVAHQERGLCPAGSKRGCRSLCNLEAEQPLRAPSMDHHVQHFGLRHHQAGDEPRRTLPLLSSASSPSHHWPHRVDQESRSCRYLQPFSFSNHFDLLSHFPNPHLPSFLLIPYDDQSSPCELRAQCLLPLCVKFSFRHAARQVPAVWSLLPVGSTPHTSCGMISK